MSHHPHKPKYGWKPDAPDFRDRIFSSGQSEFKLESMPTKVDLREHCSPVENQYKLGSCTANSVAGALEYLDLKQDDNTYEDLSRLFVYYNTRASEGTLDRDTGATLRNTIKVLATTGSCSEGLWPYMPERFKDRPSDECYVAAGKHVITEYQRINNLPDMLHCLASGYPFVLGFSVFSEFEGPNVANTGVLSLPTPTEICLGGHAVLAVGYDMDAKTFLIRNSWGKEWGQDGYFTMPFAYITNPAMAGDMWSIRK